MAITLWNLFEASVLLLNAICILHEERFLVKFGWGIKSQTMQGFDDQPSVKQQILTLIWSVRNVARVPLIFVNVILIVFKLIFG